MISEIKARKPHIPYDFLFYYFGISSSGYFDWKKRKAPLQLTSKSKIQDQIKEIFKESKGTYGSPRVYAELVERDVQISENTVAKYMRELGLNADRRPKYRVMTTDSDHTDPIAERVFRAEEENALPNGPGEVLAGDITYLKLSKYHHIYLAVVIDLFNREIVGWAIGQSLETSLITRALEAAMYVVGPDAEVVFHSDRGSQYASEAYRKLLKNNEITPSMSRKGNCYDNAYVESFFASLKKEWIYRINYQTEEELRNLVFEYIEVWYNRKRKHSSLGFLSPVNYKKLKCR